MRRFPAVLILFASATMTTLVSGAEITSSLDGNSLVWSVDRPHGGATLNLVQPDGAVVTRRFNTDDPLRLELDRNASREGQYLYELTVAPRLDEQQRQMMAEARASGTPPSIEAKGARLSGSFRNVAGEWIGSFSARTEEHPLADENDRGSPRDQVIADDLIVQFSACVGMDCVNNESFGFDTVRIKENNTRLTFIDTSNTGSFASGDWQLRANGSDNGDPNFFAIDWLGTGANSGDTVTSSPFRVDGTAPNHALRVAGDGDIGLGTPSPAVELHVRDGDTPTLRLEQDASAGFGAHTWDIAGNETNFFVRDVTNGSQLPFRVFPNAGDDMLVMRNGQVGINTDNPAARLHVADGDLRVDGSVYQLSSRATKTDFGSYDADILLNMLSSLDLSSWRYRGQGDGGRHFGPTAEDFFQLFGFGQSERHISVSDMAGVALGAAQALQHRLEDKDRRIERLEQRLVRIERLLEAGQRH